MDTKAIWKAWYASDPASETIRALCDEVDALRAQAALTWTWTQPSVVGFYWSRRLPFQGPFISEIRAASDGTLVTVPEDGGVGTRVDAISDMYEWAGPIPAPKEAP